MDLVLVLGRLLLRFSMIITAPSPPALLMPYTTYRLLTAPPTYSIAEISRPADRSVLMSGFQVAVQVCALLGFWSAYAANALVSSTSNLQWQIPVAVQLVPAAILLLGASYVPETPHYLAANGKNGMVEIQRSLAWFRGREEDDTEVLFEANEIHRNALASRRAVQLQDEKSFLREAFSRPIRKRLGVGVGLMVAQNVVGLVSLPLSYYESRTVTYENSEL